MCCQQQFKDVLSAAVEKGVENIKHGKNQKF